MRKGEELVKGKRKPQVGYLGFQELGEPAT
jgi:hypothetical protein